MSRRPIDTELTANSEGSVRRALFLVALLFAIVLPVHAQIAEHETLGGADSYETSILGRDHLLGDWGGLRTRWISTLAVVLFAARYKSQEAETASILLLSTLSLVVTVPVTIALGR